MGCYHFSPFLMIFSFISPTSGPSQASPLTGLAVTGVLLHVGGDFLPFLRATPSGSQFFLTLILVLQFIKCLI